MCLMSYDGGCLWHFDYSKCGSRNDYYLGIIQCTFFQAQLASKSSRQETANLKAENHTLSLTICEKEESLSSLRDQFREEVIVVATLANNYCLCIATPTSTRKKNS